MPTGGPVTDYIELGLALGRHVDGMVDAYYGPPDLARRAAAGSPVAPEELVARARRLLSDIDAGEPEAGEPLDDGRRRWLRAQALGLLTTARVLAGEAIGYAEEVEACYGVAPVRADEEVFERAHRLLDEVLPGSGPVGERLIAWREAQAVPVEQLEGAIHALAEELRDRTRRMFGLPDDEHVDFELVTNKPWAGFNYYLGELRSRVAVNVDLPVLSTSLGHLVAHEAYPGHHTEHSRKEVGLVRARRHLEETIFLVGTPQCLLAEGLADLGLEVVMGARPQVPVAEVLRSAGIAYDADTAGAVAEAAEDLGYVRGNAAFMLHADGRDGGDVADYVARWAMLPDNRAAKAVEFIADPTWRAYVTCYIEGFRLCRSYVAGEPERFGRLISEQLVPEDLRAPAA